MVLATTGEKRSLTGIFSRENKSKKTGGRYEFFLEKTLNF